jgi:hypothetical protein
MREWIVGIEQRHPYSFTQLSSTFEQEDEAVAFCVEFTLAHAAVRTSRRRWRLVGAGDDGVRHLIVWSRAELTRSAAHGGRR